MVDSVGVGLVLIVVMVVEVDGIIVIIEEGVGVGVIRVEFFDVGGWVFVDDEDLMIVVNFGLGGCEVLDIELLMYFGLVGIFYLLFLLDGDIVM